MKILVCSKNLVGFLTAVYHSYYTHKDAEKIISDNAPRDFLNEYVEIEEDETLAVKVRAGILKKGGKPFYDKVALAYRSGEAQKETLLFEYLKLFFRVGRAVSEQFGDPITLDFEGMAQRVSHEISRLVGFVRFMETSSGVYYAWYSSDNDIIEYLADDFVKRYNTYPFILHDYKRKKLAISDGKRLELAEAPEDGLTVELSKNEAAFQSLWKQYHQNVSISARENLKLQRGFLPKKYRHFMNEF